MKLSKLFLAETRSTSRKDWKCLGNAVAQDQVNKASTGQWEFSDTVDLKDLLLCQVNYPGGQLDGWAQVKDGKLFLGASVFSLGFPVYDRDIILVIILDEKPKL